MINNFLKKNIYFITILLIFLVSCQPTNSRNATMTTLRIDFQEGDLPSLHPHDVLIYLRGLSIAKTLYEGLTRIDDQGQAMLSGAQSVEVSSDRMHYKFSLRDNAWSDGTPVTAFQYEHAWKEVLSPKSICPHSELLYMLKNGREAKSGLVPLSAVGVKALDAKTLVVDLSHPAPYFLELLAQPICVPLVHPETKEISAFNGPFMVQRWEKGHLLQLKPNPHFWNRKQVQIPQIDVYMIQDTNTAYSFFKEGKIDYIGVPLCNLTAEQITRLGEARQLSSHAIDRVLWIHLNTQHTALSSPLIRQALGMAITRKEITDHILIGGKPLFIPLPTTLLATSGLPAIKEDFAEANKRFDQGLKEIGLTRKTFPPITITYSQQANRKQLAEYLQQSWSRALGIDVQLEPKDWNTLRTHLTQGLFEISFTYLAPYYKDPIELLDYFSTLGTGNFAHWVNPFYSAKIYEAMQEGEFQKRTQLLGEAELYLLEQMPVIPVCTDKLMFSCNSGLKGYVFDCLGAIDFSYASLKD